MGDGRVMGGGGIPLPWRPKPIPSPGAENQGPSKNVWPKEMGSATSFIKIFTFAVFKIKSEGLTSEPLKS